MRLKYLFISLLILLSIACEQKNTESTNPVVSSPTKNSSANHSTNTFFEYKVNANPQEDKLAKVRQIQSYFMEIMSLFPETVNLNEWSIYHQKSVNFLNTKQNSTAYANYVAGLSSIMLEEYLLKQNNLNNSVKEAISFYISKLREVKQYNSSFVNALPYLKGYLSNQILKDIAQSAIAEIKKNKNNTQNISSEADSQVRNNPNESESNRTILSFVGNFSESQSADIQLLDDFINTL